MLGLRTVIYKVDDIQAATEWYTKAFNTEPYFVEPFYVGFNIGGYELGLQPEETSSVDKSESVSAYWGVADIHKAFGKLIDLGAVSVEEPTNVGGEIMVATVKDSWNNRLGIIYNPNFRLP